MGYHKDRMIQEEEQGWRFSDNNICSRCVSDPDLKQFIRETAALSPCDFCGWRGPHSVTFDSLMEIIGGTINQHYNDAVNEASWDSEDGYFGDTFDTFELFYRIGDPSNREAVNDAIRESLGIDRHWCQRHMYSLTGADRYIASWDDFCTTVKHKTRYFFDSTANDDDMGETIPVPRMLDELRDIVREASLIGTLPAGTMLFRVRPHGKAEVCNTWDTLGSPPDEVAVTNRMSAAGISVFYAAFDMNTARAEVSAGMPNADKRVLSGAMWATTSALSVLDLTKLPAIPGFYARERYDRDSLIFLHDFVDAITQPVTHDGREHIDYVPTQILTEYFRHRSLPDKGKGIDGIVYPSAQRRGGRSVTIFASQRDLDPGRITNQNGPSLVIDLGSIKRVRRSVPRQRAGP